VTLTGTTQSTSISSGILQVSGGIGITKSIFVGEMLHLSGSSLTGNPATNNGAQLYVSSQTFTDNITATSGTNTNFMSGIYLNSSTFASSSLTTTVSNASTLYISGAALSGTNVTITNAYALYINSGNSYFGSPIQLPSTAWVGLGITNSSIIANSSGTGAYVSNSVSGDLVLRSAVNIRLGISTGTSVLDVLSGQTVVNPTNDSSSTLTGSLIVSGGVGIAKSLYVNSINVSAGFSALAANGSFLGLTSSTGLLITGSTVTGNPTSQAGAQIYQTAYTFQDTSTANLGTNGQFMGGLYINAPTFSASHTTVTTTNAATLYISGPPSTGTNNTITNPYTLYINSGTSYFGGVISIGSTTDSSSVSTGALVVSGGVGISKNLYIGGILQTNALTSSNTTTVGTTVNPSTSSGGAVNFGGDLVLGASNPRIYFPISGGNAPTFINRSLGTRLIIYPNVGASSVDFAIGMGSSAIWHSIPSNVSNQFFQWYGGTTNIMTLDGTGNLSVFGTTTIVNTVNPSTSSGGALNIAGDLVLGATNPRIYFPNNGLNPPFFTNRSSGTKIVLNAGIGASGVDYAIGIDSSTMWYSIANNLSTVFHKWYGGTTNIMTLDGTGNLTNIGSHIISITTDSSSSTNGALIVSGGAGIAKNLYVGGLLNVINSATASTVIGFFYQPSLSNGNGVYLLSGVNNGVNNSAQYIFIYTGTGSTSNSMAFCLQGQPYALMINGSGIVSIPTATDSSSSSTGALIVSGGVGIAKSLYVGSTTTIGLTVNPSASSGGSVNIAGDLVLGATTPRIYFPTNGGGAPTFTNRSTGTKIILFPNLLASAVDHAIGTESGATWYSTAVNDSAHFHKWYAGTTNVMNLDGTGSLSVFGTTDSSSSTTGSLKVSGGVGITKSLYVGLSATVFGNIYMQGGTIFSGQQSIVNASTIYPTGFNLVISSNTFTDSTIASSGTISTFLTSSYIGAPTIAATNTSVTCTNAATLYISGSPINGTNTIITNPYSLYIASGTSYLGGTTDSSSSNSGSLIVSGGVGIAKKLTVGTGIAVTGATSIAPSFDTSASTAYSVTNGSNQAVTSNNGYYIVFICETTNTGGTAIYMCGNGVAALVSTNLDWVASTTTPAAGRFSVAYNGSTTYNVYNNFGSTCTFKVSTFRMA
jgi:hypothetical protein